MNDVIGSESISGTLTTDGTVGEDLGASIFTDFMLTISNGVKSDVYTPLNAYIGSANTNGVVATATTLSLGSSGGQFVLFYPPPTGSIYLWLLENAGALGGGLELIQDPMNSAGNSQGSEDRQVTVFATASPSTPGTTVPDP